MATISWRVSLTSLVSMAVMATGLTLAFAAPGAGAQPIAPAHGRGGGTAPGAKNGDNGTVKIHNSTTPVTDPRNEPHVCVFYLDAFGFDPAQSVSWQIKSWPPTGDRTVVASGALALDSNGTGHTGDMTLQNGHYKLFWNFAGEHGFAKQKVFWVACAAPPRRRHSHADRDTAPTPPVTPSSSPTPPASAAPAPTPVKTTLPVTG